jgi:hypothetical protein
MMADRLRVAAEAKAVASYCDQQAVTHKKRACRGSVGRQGCLPGEEKTAMLLKTGQMRMESCRGCIVKEAGCHSTHEHECRQKYAVLQDLLVEMRMSREGVVAEEVEVEAVVDSSGALKMVKMHRTRFL